MDKTELWLSVTRAAQSLTDAWIIKIAASFFIAALCSFHTKLLFAFTILVFVDLLTKWIALSKKYLDDKGRESSFGACLMNIKKARRAGYIKSDVMKTRFIAKIMVYILITISAAALDWVLMTTQKPEFAVVVVVTYLSVTEFISLLENMQGAGIEEAGKLREIIKGKAGL